MSYRGPGPPSTCCRRPESTSIPGFVQQLGRREVVRGQHADLAALGLHGRELGYRDAADSFFCRHLLGARSNRKVEDNGSRPPCAASQLRSGSLRSVRAPFERLMCVRRPRYNAKTESCQSTRQLWRPRLPRTTASGCRVLSTQHRVPGTDVWVPRGLRTAASRAPPIRRGGQNRRGPPPPGRFTAGPGPAHGKPRKKTPPGLTKDYICSLMP